MKFYFNKLLIFLTSLYKTSNQNIRTGFSSSIKIIRQFLKPISSEAIMFLINFFHSHFHESHCRNQPSVAKHLVRQTKLSLQRKEKKRNKT